MPGHSRDTGLYSRGTCPGCPPPPGAATVAYIHLLGVFALFVLQHGFIIPLFNIFAETDCSIPWCDGMLYARVKLFVSLTDLGTGSPTCG